MPSKAPNRNQPIRAVKGSSGLSLLASYWLRIYCIIRATSEIPGNPIIPYSALVHRKLYTVCSSSEDARSILHCSFGDFKKSWMLMLQKLGCSSEDVTKKLECSSEDVTKKLECSSKDVTKTWVLIWGFKKIAHQRMLQWVLIWGLRNTSLLIWRFQKSLNAHVAKTWMLIRGCYKNLSAHLRMHGKHDCPFGDVRNTVIIAHLRISKKLDCSSEDVTKLESSSEEARK
jgi:hypothetical protein